MANRLGASVVSVFLQKPGTTVPAIYPRITLTPRDVRWNDFGYNYHATAELSLSDEEPPLSLLALVVPVKSYDGETLDLHRNFDDWLGDELRIRRKLVLDAETDLDHHKSAPPFAVLFQGETSYRELAERVESQQLRIDMLLKANDVVMLRHAHQYSSFIDALLTARPVTLGVMRTASAYRALHRGERYLWGNFARAHEEARVELSFSCFLKGFHEQPHRLTVSFVDNNVIEDRIHCLVGKNGCGKTRVLHELILHLGNRAAAGEDATPFLNHETSSAHGEPTYQGMDYGRVICFSFDSESRFPTGVRNNSRFEYIYANLNAARGSEAAEENSVDQGEELERDDPSSQGVSAASGETTTRLLVDILRNSDSIGTEKRTRWELFKEALQDYVDISKLELPLLRDEVAAPAAPRLWIGAQNLQFMGEQASLEKYALIDHGAEARFADAGEEIPLSSGERMFFRFALNLLSYVDDGTLLIIDEPETHLHPNLVCDFMNLLYKVLTATRSVALVATHSAYVVREVPKHCAHIYSIDEERRPQETFAYLKTLGANIESISQAIFADSNARKFHAKIARSMANEGLTLDELIEKYSEMISPDMLSRVARLLAGKSESEEGQI